MRVGGQSLARGTEVSVVAHDTLVANTLDVQLGPLILAKRAVAVDAMVSDRDKATSIRGSLIYLGKTVAWVGMASPLDASAAIVKVGTGEALVAYTPNVLHNVSSNVQQKQIVYMARTLSQPSQMALWRTSRPAGSRAFSAAVSLVLAAAASN